MANGIRYKITNYLKATFMKACNKAHINNFEEFSCL